MTCIIPVELSGQRLDQALAALYPEFSRSRLQQWLRAGHVLVDGVSLPAKTKVVGGEAVVVQAQPAVDVTVCVAEPITLDVVFEDEQLLVLNKPAGLVMHPAAGNYQGTLQNGLLHYDARLVDVPRSGIVHRLDKDTTGLVVIAKTLVAHQSLVTQLQARSVKRVYEAVVVGDFIAGGTVSAPIGRHAVDRKRMAVRSDGKEAITHYRILRRFGGYTHIQLRLETGRTHQIRVHMAHMRSPVVGDPVYGGRLRLPKGADQTVIDTLRHFKRQALHAVQLSLLHPVTGEALQWQVPLPADMQHLLAVLCEAYQ